MKTATPKKPAVKPAVRRSPRALWLVGLPAIAVVAGLASQSSLFGPKAMAAPADKPVHLAKPASETDGGYRATKNSLVFVREAPAPAQDTANQNGFVYVKPGAKTSGITRANRGPASVATERAGTTAAGGVVMQMSPSFYPYARAQVGANGKNTVQCVEPLKGSNKAKSEHSH